MFRTTLLLISTVLLTTNMNAVVKVDKIEYVTGDVGPRVIRFGFVGGQNLFKEFPDELGKSGEERFRGRGGDRVWKAPEDHIGTYVPDNDPVEIHVTPIASEGVAPNRQSFSLPAGICSLGGDDDAPGQSRGCGVSAARTASHPSGGHQPTGNVGVYEPFGPALEVHEKVPHSPPGSN